MSVCGQTGHWVQTSFGCFIYDFQTLLIGAAAIIVAIVFGIPVWRQLKDTNLQTRISHQAEAQRKVEFQAGHISLARPTTSRAEVSPK